MKHAPQMHRILLVAMAFAALIAMPILADNNYVVEQPQATLMTSATTADNYCPLVDTGQPISQVATGVTTMPVTTGMKHNRITSATSEINGTNFLDSSTNVVNEITGANSMSAGNSFHSSGVMYPVNQQVTTGAANELMVNNGANEIQIATTNQASFDGNFSSSSGFTEVNGLTINGAGNEELATSTTDSFNTGFTDVQTVDNADTSGATGTPSSSFTLNSFAGVADNEAKTDVMAIKQQDELKIATTTAKRSF